MLAGLALNLVEETPQLQKLKYPGPYTIRLESENLRALYGFVLGIVPPSTLWGGVHHHPVPRDTIPVASSMPCFCLFLVGGGLQRKFRYLTQCQSTKRADA